MPTLTLNPAGLIANGGWNKVGIFANFEDCVKPPDDDDSSYVFSNGSTSDIVFQMDDPTGLPAGAVISSVVVHAKVKKASGAPQVGAKVETAGDITDGGVFSTASLYGQKTWTFSTSPDTGVAWTASELDDATFRVRLYCSDTDEIDVTTMTVDINYTVPAGSQWFFGMR